VVHVDLLLTFSCLPPTALHSPTPLLLLLLLLQLNPPMMTPFSAS
jgi:hypothetical protein